MTDTERGPNLRMEADAREVRRGAGPAPLSPTSVRQEFDAKEIGITLKSDEPDYHVIGPAPARVLRCALHLQRALARHGHFINDDIALDVAREIGER